LHLFLIMKTVAFVLVAAAVGLHCSAPGEAPEGPGQEPGQEIVASPEPSRPRAPSGTASSIPESPNADVAALVHNGATPHATSTVRDESGATYVTGTFVGSVGIGGTVIASRGDKDVFLLKLDPAGAFQWVRAVGSASDESAPRVTLDDERVTVVGMTKGEMDCGSGPRPKWNSETFFVCIFGGADGTSLASGVFPTGSP
jgi:hypothetical protein